MNIFEDPRWIDLRQLPRLVSRQEAEAMYEDLKERYGGEANPSTDKDLFIVVQVQDSEGKVEWMPLYNTEERDRRIKILEADNPYPETLSKVKAYYYGLDEAMKGVLIMVPPKRTKKTEK